MLVCSICGNCMVGLNNSGSRGRDLDPVKRVKNPSNLLLTVPRRYFCCCSSVLHVMSVCIWFLAIWSAEYQLPIMSSVLFCFVI